MHVRVHVWSWWTWKEGFFAKRNEYSLKCPQEKFEALSNAHLQGHTQFSPI